MACNFPALSVLLEQQRLLAPAGRRQDEHHRAEDLGDNVGKGDESRLFLLSW